MSCFAYILFLYSWAFKKTLYCNAISLQPKRNIVKYCEEKKKNIFVLAGSFHHKASVPTFLRQTHTQNTRQFYIKFQQFLLFFLKNSLLLHYFTTDSLCVLASAFPPDVIQSLNLGYTMSLHQRQNMHQICRIILTCWSFFSVRVSNERDWSIVFLLLLFFLQVTG